MKKLFLGALLLLSMLSFSQTNLKFIYEKDVMTDKEYVHVNNLFEASEDGKTGFFIKPWLKFENNTIVYHGLIVVSVGVGSCMEKDKLIILFDDNTKIELISWQDFNCKGNSYFDLYGKAITNLNKKIKAIRLTNGRSFESYTYEPKTENQRNYFVDVNNLLISQKYENSPTKQ